MIADEAVLLEKARSLDPHALGQIYDAYFERLYRYAYRYLGDADAAQDAAAEALRRLLEALCAGQPLHQLGPWLYRVTYNVLVDLHRRAPPGRFTPLEDAEERPGEGDTEASAEDNLAQAWMRQAISRLTPDQQQVIVLKFMEGYSNAEVGQMLDKPEGAVKSLQHRALAALRRWLAQPARASRKES